MTRLKYKDTGQFSSSVGVESDRAKAIVEIVRETATNIANKKDGGKRHETWMKLDEQFKDDTEFIWAIYILGTLDGQEFFAEEYRKMAAFAQHLAGDKPYGYGD